MSENSTGPERLKIQSASQVVGSGFPRLEGGKSDSFTPHCQSRR